MGERASYLRIGDVDVWSEVVGHGEPVLLLHGGFLSAESLRPLVDALAPEFEVFTFERPGHGRTADVEGEYGYARGVAETLGYLDAQGLDAAHVVGFSDGGNIGLLLALGHPGRVRSLVTISANLDPSAFANTPGPVPTLDVAPAAGPEVDAERLAYDRLSPDGPAHADVVLAKLFRLWESEPRIAPVDLAAVRAPTLVVSADRDTVRPDHSLLIAASVPGAQLAIVPGATHDLLAERPGLLATLVLEFLGV